MPEPIEFYFDFSSPYAYFVYTKVDDLAADFGRAVTWRPYMMGAAFPRTGQKPLTEQPLRGAYAMHDWQRLARFMDMPWTLPEKFPYVALAPSRAFYWLEAQDPETAKALAKRVLHGYFGEGREMSSPEAVAGEAEALGVDPAALIAATQEPAVKDRLKQVTTDAVERGIFGSPTIVVDGEMFWGSDRLWMVKRWLKSGGW